MKYSAILIPLSLGLLILPGTGMTQDTEALKKEASSVFSDPRFKSAFRKAKKDPEAALKEADVDTDEMVRSVTRAFNENKDKIDTDKIEAAAKKIDTKQIESVAKELKSQPAAESAISSLTSMLPKPPPSESDVPATRPAPGNGGIVARPIAMPVPGATASDDTPAILRESTTVVQEASVMEVAGLEATTPQIPDSPALNPDDIPAPQPLAPKYNTQSGGGQLGSSNPDNMEILAREAILDDENGLLTFRGDVYVKSNDPAFEITCEKLEIHTEPGMSGKSEGSKKSGEKKESFKRVVASGGMVEIRRISPEGKTQIALGRRADYDNITKDMILTGGPPYIQDGKAFVKTRAADAQIIMRGNGLYEIKGSNNRNHISIPIKGPDQTKDIGVPSGLGGFR